MPGIELVRQTEDGVELFCDCGATTVLAGSEPGAVLTGTAERIEQEFISVPPSGGEVAFTCPGCGTAHWLTFSPRQPPTEGTPDAAT